MPSPAEYNGIDTSTTTIPPTLFGHAILNSAIASLLSDLVEFRERAQMKTRISFDEGSGNVVTTKKGKCARVRDCVDKNVAAMNADCV